MKPEIFLNLGCGDSVLPAPWVNIDHRMQPGVDRVDNIGTLRRYEPNSVGRIYCCHALDHFDRYNYQRVLSRWHELLAPGSELWVSVVDFSVISKLYRNGTPLRSLIGALAAGQEYPGNVRHVHFDFEFLFAALSAAGFKNMRRHDGPFFDSDCSAAKIDGSFISLNMVAEK